MNVAFVFDNPAQVHDWVCECGMRLQHDGDIYKCPGCGKGYKLKDNKCATLREERRR